MADIELYNQQELDAKLAQDYGIILNNFEEWKLDPNQGFKFDNNQKYISTIDASKKGMGLVVADFCLFFYERFSDKPSVFSGLSSSGNSKLLVTGPTKYGNQFVHTYNFSGFEHELKSNFYILGQDERLLAYIPIDFLASEDSSKLKINFRDIFESNSGFVNSCFEKDLGIFLQASNSFGFDVEEPGNIRLESLIQNEYTQRIIDSKRK